VRTAPRASETNAALLAETARCAANFHAALEHDLNTAEARAAIFELVRAGNAAADHHALGAENVGAIEHLLARFDQVFQLLVDHDAESTRAAVTWAEAEGRLDEVAPELLAQRGLTDEAIDTLIAERNQARQRRNFARADAIRKELEAKGILIEDAKDGVRWKRK
jgi:cysteinyl-tRNA synthetase